MQSFDHYHNKHKSLTMFLLKMIMCDMTEATNFFHEAFLMGVYKPLHGELCLDKNWVYP
jgi:hypothetical protein